MLRTILTSISLVFFISISLVFFVAAGLLLIFTGDSATRTVGFVSVFFFGVLGGLALLGILRRRGGGAEQKNSQAVARERMLASVAYMNGQIHNLNPSFDSRGPVRPKDLLQHDLIQEWVERQTPESFETFLELITEPAPEFDDPYQGDELWWISLSRLLSAWVCSDADHIFDQISLVVSVDAARPVLLETFAQIADTSCIQESPERREQMALWLKPWQAQAETLPEMEREWLEEAATFCAPAC